MMAKLKRLESRLQTISHVRLPTVSDSWRDDRTSSSQRGYGYKWQQARIRYLQEHSLCVYCEKDGITTTAEVVDHIIPHRGNKELFWDKSNWQSLCKSCHSSVKQKEESQ